MRDRTAILIPIDAETRERVKAAAAAEHRTMAQQLRYLIDRWLEESDTTTIAG